MGQTDCSKGSSGFLPSGPGGEEPYGALHLCHFIWKKIAGMVKNTEITGSQVLLSGKTSSRRPFLSAWSQSCFWKYLNSLYCCQSSELPFAFWRPGGARRGDTMHILRPQPLPSILISPFLVVSQGGEWACYDGLYPITYRGSSPREHPVQPQTHPGQLLPPAVAKATLCAWSQGWAPTAGKKFSWPYQKLRQRGRSFRCFGLRKRETPFLLPCQ